MFSFAQKLKFRKELEANGEAAPEAPPAPAVGPRPPPPAPAWTPPESADGELGPSAQTAAVDAAMPDEREIALSNQAAIQERWAKDEFFQRTLAKYGKRPPLPEPEPEVPVAPPAPAVAAEPEIPVAPPAPIAEERPPVPPPAVAPPAPGMPTERDIALSNLAAKEERWANDELFQKTLAKYRK